MLTNASGSSPSVAAGGAGANLLMAYPGVDLDVIYDLVDGGYVTGPHRWATTYGLDLQTPDAEKHLQCCVEQYRKHGTGFFNFRATTRGKRWVCNDPPSVLLASVWMSAQRRMSLHEAMGFSDRDTIVWAVDGGYLTVQNVDGQERRRCGGDEFRLARQLRLVAALKARNVLG